MSRKISALAVIVMLFCACGVVRADAMRLAAECEDLYDNGRYDAALSLIDSLRRTYPEVTGARKKAFVIYQKAELAKAQEDVKATDKALQQASVDFHAIDSVVVRHKADGVVTAEELTRHTRMRMMRDSLQTRFDVQCAKIRFIKKKMKE